MGNILKRTPSPYSSVPEEPISSLPIEKMVLHAFDACEELRNLLLFKA